jgi:hypothetical protein
MTSLAVGITHFQALAFFALTVSLTFAFLSKTGAADRVKYFVWAFLTFLAVAVGIGWLLYPFSR